MTVEQIAGAGLMVLFLADIFLTVLYARAGTGLLAPRWNRIVWNSVKILAGLFRRRRSAALSFAGPVIVVALIAFWAIGLTTGAALIIRPELGDAIQPSNGGASTDFVTALLVAGNSLSIVGGGDYSPHTSATRILFLVNSLIGASVLSLVLSYLVQVYSALRERNALALTVDLMTGGTGDAAEILARLGPDGNFSNATSELSNLVRSRVNEGGPSFLSVAVLLSLYGAALFCVTNDICRAGPHHADRNYARSAEAWRFGALGSRRVPTELCAPFARNT